MQQLPQQQARRAGTDDGDTCFHARSSLVIVERDRLPHPVEMLQWCTRDNPAVMDEAVRVLDFHKLGSISAQQEHWR